jgi:hypothetical protein
MNKFLEGKKKYSVFWLTLLAAVIQLFTLSPEAQQEVTSWIPTLATILSGITYLIIEGIRDIKRTAPNQPPPLEPIAVSVPSPASTTTSQEQPPAAEQKAPRWNEDAVWNEIDQRVEGIYSVRNPCTVYYCARDYIIPEQKYTLTYDRYRAQEFLVRLAEEAFKSLWGKTYDEVRINPQDKECKYPNIKFMAMQLGMAYYAILIDLENERKKLQEI